MTETTTTLTAAPTTTAPGTTELLVGIYREALGAAGLDEHSDFYENGGDSLTAFQVTARLQEVLGVEVPVALVFAYPTPADLADVVDTDLLQG
ncbi:acyl carrier protein [Streptomyces coeruleoprunus]|uniref:Acyl carrier protein n=1 Tax=Streptomyces coeruleoprunus TaxID=285563 RepID=A0ABV9XB32_9ACTN